MPRSAIPRNCGLFAIVWALWGWFCLRLPPLGHARQARHNAAAMLAAMLAATAGCQIALALLFFRFSSCFFACPLISLPPLPLSQPAVKQGTSGLYLHAQSVIVAVTGFPHASTGLQARVVDLLLLQSASPHWRCIESPFNRA